MKYLFFDACISLELKKTQIVHFVFDFKELGTLTFM